MMKLSKIAREMETSLTRQLFNKTKGLSDVIDLTLGDPDLKPSQTIRDAACEAIQQGRTRYSVNAGILDAREAIAECVKSEYGIEVDPVSEVMLTIGGMGALYLSLAAIVDPGDEVLLIGPYYVNYIQMVKMTGGIPVILYTDPEEGFKIDVSKLADLVTDKTVALLINSPCNPTGTIINEATLDSLSEFAKENDIAVISDEVYRTLIYDGKAPDSIITRPGMKERTILVDSMSKRFAMTGYRCGFAIAPDSIISSMTKMQENTASCTPLPSQYAAIAGYSLCKSDSSICEEFERRRDYIWRAISTIPELSCKKPEGTFYLFVDIRKTGLTAEAFALGLLEDQHVAVVPGNTYGEPYSGFIRIAFTMGIERLREAVSRIEAYIKKLRENDL